MTQPLTAMTKQLIALGSLLLEWGYGLAREANSPAGTDNDPAARRRQAIETLYQAADAFESSLELSGVEPPRDLLAGLGAVWQKLATLP